MTPEQCGQVEMFGDVWAAEANKLEQLGVERAWIISSAWGDMLARLKAGVHPLEVANGGVIEIKMLAGIVDEVRARHGDDLAMGMIRDIAKQQALFEKEGMPMSLNSARHALSFAIGL